MTSATRAEPPSIAIVGNAPGMGDRAVEIDACDRVVRFNNAPGFGYGAGRRVTELALVNRGGQPREWVEDDALRDLAALRGAREVIFPFPPLLRGPPGLCWTREMTSALAAFRLRPRVLEGTLHEAARVELQRFGADARPRPSTGFLVACDLVRQEPAGTSIRVFGFGFAGWDGHPWAAERRWFEHQHAAGRLDLVPLLGSS